MASDTPPSASLRVLVTGTSTGIGRATVELLSHRGHHVIATCRDVAAIADLPAARTLQLDVTDAASVRVAIDEAGPLDVLINNAGRGMRAPVELASSDTLEQLWATNVLGPVQTIQAVLPTMRERGRGRIVNVSSVAGRRAMPLTGHYSATKHALEALSEALRIELAAFGIDVTLVEPGAVTTAFAANRLGIDEFGPYNDLAARASAWASDSNAPAQTAVEVAQVVVEAVEAQRPIPLRWPTSTDVANMIEDRQGRSFDEYERWVLHGLGQAGDRA